MYASAGMPQPGMGWGGHGHVQPMGIQWIPMSGGAVPPYATQAGLDSGRELYVIRAYHQGGMIPGKLHVGHSSAYIAYGGEEVPTPNYEVLVAPVASLSWVDGQGSFIPPNAVPGGRDPGGETYYIGRVWLNGTITVGKIHPSHGSCYVPYGGKEHPSHTYEILVKNALGRAMNV
ncbi:uncharacterized protein LOC110853773 [Folsomia candida]|uniref:Natterin-2 n=1 Tax=Folsomia candida TaxID=158441 RepID=A0A226DYJ7_FOLCA|nr:uncharacterized protein LOC110853773 [Folsomia candida]XP_021957794.1 uncharacterized protein LOC110853773 [Folsomia candida]XP_021957795.1 uncharacterized protein LOC110853773 [Folsomia candida]OXA50535.1 Natterin-2 [Folsomia candida]